MTKLTDKNIKQVVNFLDKFELLIKLDKANLKKTFRKFFMKGWNINATPYHKNADEEFKDYWKHYLGKLLEAD